MVDESSRMLSESVGPENIAECLSIIKSVANEDWSDPGVLIGIAGVVVAIAAVWYARRQLIAFRTNAIQQLSALKESTSEQLSAMSANATRERTLQICLSYDRDPVISAEVKILRQALEQKDLSGLSKHTVRTILNYFDVIAIGIHQNSYDFEIVFYQFRHIIPSIVRDILSEDDKVYYPDLVLLVTKITERDSSEKMAR